MKARLVKDLWTSLVVTHRGQDEKLRELGSRLDRIESMLPPSGQVVQVSNGTGRAEVHTSRYAAAFPPPLAPRFPGVETILRQGVRVTVTDFIWKELGTGDPSDLTDQQIDRCLKGPFCRHCLRSLVFTGGDRERWVRAQCQHCLLTWRMDHPSGALPLARFKRSLYEDLDAEFRRTGTLALHGE